MATDINCSSAGAVTVRGYRPDVLQVKDRIPEDNDTAIAPNRHVRFSLLCSGRGRIEDFENDLPAEWELATTGNGYSHTSWNSGTDNWDVYTDSGNKVLRCQGRGAVTWAAYQQREKERPFWFQGRQDFIARVKWHTGAQAGLIARMDVTTYGKETRGMDGVAAWIDSGGFRIGWISNGGTPDVDSTSSFSPVDGTWYWIRFQIHRENAVRYRAKYWTGDREAEPAGWTFSWDYPTDNKDQRDQRALSNGFFCWAGTAFFDDFEQRDELDTAYLDQLTVTINGTDYEREDWIDIQPLPVDEVWESDTAPFADQTAFIITIDPWLVHDNDDRSQAVTVKWNQGDGDLTLQTWSWDSASFPQDNPAHDPSESTDYGPPGDPTRMGSFALSSGSVIVPRGRYFTWLLELFPESMGNQHIAFNIAQMTWPSAQAGRDFVWNLISSIYTAVNGEYLIGHPVWTDHAASVVPAEVVQTDHAANVVVKGDVGQDHAASVVPQAYTWTDHAASVCIGIVLWWEGDAAVVISQEELLELDASMLAYKMRLGSTLHLRVLDAAVFAQLNAMGIELNPSIYASLGEVVVEGLQPTILSSGIIHAGLGTVEVQGYNPTVDVPVVVQANLGTVEVQGYNVNIQGPPLDIDVGNAGAVVVTGHNLAQIDDYFMWDADHYSVGEYLWDVMDQYLNRWIPSDTVDVVYDIYTYSSDQTLRCRQPNDPAKYHHCWYDVAKFNFGTGTARIRIMGYLLNNNGSLRIRLRDSTGSDYIGAQVEKDKWVIGDLADWDRSGFDTGYSAGPFTIVMEFDGSSYKGKRVDSLSPTLTFDNWDINYSHSKSVDSDWRPEIAIGNGTFPLDHGYITKMEWWNDWS